MTSNESGEAALRYVSAGLCVLPNLKDAKRPAVSWKTYQQRLPREDEIQWWFPEHRVGILCGAISGHAEMIDFDNQGSHFEAWANIVAEWQPDLIEKLVIEKSPSGGYHVLYRCPEFTIPGNMKLAEMAIERPDAAEFQHHGKNIKPRKIGEKFYGIVCLIETRGEGGQFVCAPSEGYTLLTADFTHVQNITATERELLINAARLLNEWQEPQPAKAPTNHASGFNSDAPGIADIYNRETDFSDLLGKHGWKQVRSSGKYSYWRRPGKAESWSASVIDGLVLKVFSSNAAPFDGGKAYSKFQAYSVLEHGGDYSKAAKALLALRPRQTRPVYENERNTAVPVKPEPVDVFKELTGQLEDESAGRRFACEWPWDHVTRLSRALYPSTITVLCSAKGASKSFMLIEAARFWWRKGYKIAVLMLEKDRKFHMRRAWAQEERNADLTDIEWSTKNPLEAKKLMYKHKDMLNGLGPCIYEVLDGISTKNILQWVEARANEGCRIIAIDPITAKDPAQRPWIDDHQFMITAQKILRDSQSSLVLVTHPPKTPARDKGSKHWGDDVAGGMAYQNFSDSILNLEYMPKGELMTVQTPHGVIQNWVNRKLQLRKTRDASGQGFTIGFFFNGKTLCFEERGVLDV